MTTTYTFPTLAPRPALEANTVYLTTGGDLREPANIAGWPTQKAFEQVITDVLAEEGWSVTRAFDVDPEKGHGFVTTQAEGMEVFRHIPKEAPLVVVICTWQYSHHVLPGLRDHEGPVLTVANFAPDWPGLVGLANLNASLTKADIPYSTIWSVDGTDEWFRDGIRSWLRTGKVEHDASHVRALPQLPESEEKRLGVALAKQLKNDKAILGVFDEGCMGMYNAIIDDELLNPMGMYKERLSQSELWAQMLTVPDEEAAAVGQWLRDRGMTFKLGTDDATELTEEQLTWQYKMYIAALRLADDFGLDAIGIQYQQGLKNLSPASDLVEGLLNNVERPEVTSRDGSRVLYEGQALPCFNEVDEGVGVDSLVTNRVFNAMGLDPANTLHDIRWGDEYEGEFVWVYEISGSVPASHLPNGYASAEAWRQDPVFFPKGGATLKGVAKPGINVWSRVFIEDGELHVDMGIADVVALPEEETERRSNLTNPEWPISHVVLRGITRDQFMARHKSNHNLVVYVPDEETALKALTAKAAMFEALGVKVHLCGEVDL
ncbi:L-fucose isomerase-like protein [Georgenia soli]|uniref:L-fucose isomerase-like protein n=1 Tax=Georgenia soli TaxID=638953 RepID=A0A2A9ES23_9MICO|nr:fucose isomerase [Georgenia soli]PFG41045.1 L-fucose isomerase-like protein [Georgenia soli]